MLSLVPGHTLLLVLGRTVPPVFGRTVLPVLGRTLMLVLGPFVLGHRFLLALLGLKALRSGDDFLTGAE